jgi:hypothetical protein
LWCFSELFVRFPKTPSVLQVVHLSVVVVVVVELFVGF